MPNSNRIKKNEQFKLSSGKLTIKSIAGDAHLTMHRIYYDNKLIKSGEGIVVVDILVEAGKEIYIEATINLPDGSSDYASLSVEMNDDRNYDRWDYSSPKPESGEVIYEVSIILI
jgi:hypothetical protein